MFFASVIRSSTWIVMIVSVFFFLMNTLESAEAWVKPSFWTLSLRSAPCKYQLDLEIAKKIKFFQNRPEWIPSGTSYKNIVLSSLNQKLFCLRFFSFRCTKSAKIDRKWAAYPEARKLKSKGFHKKPIVPRIFISFLLMDDVIHERRKQSNSTHSLTRFWLIYSLTLD